MEVKLDKRYPVAASPAQAWAVLRDVHAVAGCMPGASITEQIDATHYKGAVKVKIGPATAAFSGDIELLALDEAARHMQLLGKGADRSGSTASMNLSARVEAGDTPEQAVLVGEAAVIVNGKFAQFGGRMLVQVSDMILAQFAGNFSLAAAAVPAVPVKAEAPAVAVAAAAAVDAEPASAVADVATAAPATAGAASAPAAVGGAAAQAGAPAPSVATPAPVLVAAAAPAPAPRTAAPPAQPQTELNGLAIAWMLIKSWFAGLFGKRS
jgi:carbon monoxide dehydrogenase subunit G